MTEFVTDLSATVVAHLRAAAEALIAVLPAGEPLVVGEAGRTVDPIDGQALTVRFSGAVSGELVLVVDRPVVDALAQSPLGPLELAHALKPALDAAAAALGRVALGPVQELSAGPALDTVLARPGALVVPLRADSTVRGAVAIALTDVPSGSPGGPRTGSLSERAGMELLRSVEMDVTAELGRTRMTLNELLSLADGAVIELDRAAGAPADLLVNGRLIARGEVVVIDENFGLRITEIVSGDH